MTGGGSSLLAVQALLRLLATGRDCAELGTAFGEGAAALAETARSVVTVERDPSAEERLRDGVPLRRHELQRRRRFGE
jgi:predicted O-methyltransferase YrrM